MEGIAWLLNEEVFDNAWPGFFVEAAVFLLVAAAAGFFAYRSVKAGAPPMPEQAIEEAKLIKGRSSKARPSAPPRASSTASCKWRRRNERRPSPSPRPARPAARAAEIRRDIDAQRGSSAARSKRCASASPS